MTFRTGINLTVLTVFLAVAAAWASAQVTRPPSSETGIKPMDLVAPQVISGSDLGFRVESNRDGVPVGRLVVRINGRWVDAQVGTSGQR